jgi:hypothetical protein
MEEPVLDLLKWSGLGLTFSQDAANPTINVDVFEPKVWQQPLTVESGIIINGSWSTNDPEATRGVVGGPGDGVDRAFWPMVTATDLESTYRDVVEVFRDATSANITWPPAITDDLLKVAKYFLLRSEVAASDKTEFQSFLNTAGAKGLEEGVPTSGLSLELSETETFHFGGVDGIQLGDTITATSRGLTFTDRITEANLSWDATDGIVVTPRVGTKTDDPDRQLAEAVAALARTQIRLSTSK